jgi:CSLREA domain-containing protein
MRRAVAIVIPTVGALLMALVTASGAGAATIHVTRTADPTPNGCHLHDCSLREAVIEANGTGAADTVVLKAKTYKLRIEGSDEDPAM